ncbi:MAG: hypothetical protein JSS66_05735 [Armatimonadetes bacterium]|nr:hypothetical protein [Armatimonadota bacterium]
MAVARQAKRDEAEHRLQTAMDVIAHCVTQAANKGLGKVNVKYTATTKLPYLKHWIGECNVVDWDGGENSDVNANGLEITKRLQALGFTVFMTTSGLDVKWDTAPDSE